MTRCGSADNVPLCTSSVTYTQSHTVTQSHTWSHIVTQSHTESHVVTHRSLLAGTTSVMTRCGSADSVPLCTSSVTYTQSHTVTPSHTESHVVTHSHRESRVVTQRSLLAGTTSVMTRCGSADNVPLCTSSVTHIVTQSQRWVVFQIQVFEIRV